MHLWDTLLPKGKGHLVQLLKLWQGNAREVLRQVASRNKAIWYVYNDGGDPAGPKAHAVPEGIALATALVDAQHGPFFLDAVVVVEVMHTTDETPRPDDPTAVKIATARRVTIWIR